MPHYITDFQGIITKLSSLVSVILQSMIWGGGGGGNVFFADEHVYSL